LPLLSNFALDIAIRKVKIRKDWNWMEHISSWSLLTMLIYLLKT
jgi:hypothetical protein